MHALAPIIYDLAIMLGVASIVALIFQRLRQPLVLGYLVAGMIVGPYTPPHALVNDLPNIQTLSQLGVVFLMFALGLEFSFQKLMRVGFSAAVTGVAEVIFMIMVGYGTGFLLGWSHYDSLFLGAALSISSTTIIIKAIEELRLKTKRFAEIIFGILIIEDLVAILLLVALSTIVVTQDVFSYDMATAAYRLVLVIGGWFLVGYFFVPSLFRFISRYLNQETLTILAVALCLFLVAVAAYFHYSTALGAFIMGSILAETDISHRIEELILPIRDIFAAVFFISVGMLIDPRIFIAHWDSVLLITLVTIVSKIIATSMASLLTGQSVDTSMRVGFSMAQIGEFSFIIAALGLSLKVTSHELYPIIVAVSAITTFTTPYLIRLSGKMCQYLDKWIPERTKFFLENYSAWVYRALTTSQSESSFYRGKMRLLINAMIVAIIFTLVDHIPLQSWFHWHDKKLLLNTTELVIALVCSSPFIWGMLFSIDPEKLPDYGKTHLSPAVFIVWLITLAEIAFLSIAYFHSLVTITVFSLLAMVFFIFAYRHLEKSYYWFEHQLVSNIKLADAHDRQHRYEELAPWDTHLVEIEVGSQSRFVGLTLLQCQIREKYGVNIVAIAHRGHMVAAPRGGERILAHDKLIVLGNDKQIDAFRMDVEVAHEKVAPKSFLPNFTLKAILIDADHVFVGKTIRQTGLREILNGLVVGMERDNKRILNPNVETVLQPDDLLLIVGETKKVEGM